MNRTADWYAAAVGDRLNPGFLHPRRYVLRALRKCMEEMLLELGEGGGLAVDYGCGDAPYKALLSSGFDYVAADLPGNSAADVELGPGGTIPLESGMATLLLSSQVLEHVPSPLAYLTEAMRILRPGGHLLLSTHGVWQYHPHPLDLRRWTREGLIAELGAVGFEVLHVKSVLGPLAVPIQLLQDALAPRLPRLMRPGWGFLGQAFVGIADVLTSSGDDHDAAIYVVLAQKPQEAPSGQD